MKISDNGLNLIKEFEGLRLTAYDDLNPNKDLQKGDQIIGKLTIGYGHTRDVYIGQKITRSTAEAYLRQDVEFAEVTVRSAVTAPITQNMFDALVSLVYNIGSHNFADKKYGSNPYYGSTLLHKLNKLDYNGAAERFEDFVRSGGNVLAGLVRRRKAEKVLFESHMFIQTYQDPKTGGSVSITDGMQNEDVVMVEKKKDSLNWLLLLLALGVWKLA